MTINSASNPWVRKEPIALGSHQTEIGDSPIRHAYANRLERRTFLTQRRMRKTGEKKYQDAADPTVLALDLQTRLQSRLLIHGHNILTEETSPRQDE